MIRRGVKVSVKICGVTSAEDARMCVDAGADMIGLNFVEGSPRRLAVNAARQIADAIRGRAVLVGVVADGPIAWLQELVAQVGLDRLQLHGDEPPEAIDALAPIGFKALRVREPADVAAASRYGGEWILVDARVDGQLGGTGLCLDPTLVAPLAEQRAMILAGGLTAANVHGAILAVRPFGVDVASGVEASPRKKDPRKVLAFVRAARDASA